MNPRKPILVGHTRFCLLDANVVAGYYLPESLSDLKAQKRIKSLMDAVRKNACPEVFLYIPNFCIAEVFAVFARYHWARWAKRVKKVFPRKMRCDRYQKICQSFHKDIHNGAIIQQVELNRYHVLATDLISPVDAYYQFYRHRPGGAKHRKAMMSGADHLIVGMGIYLAKIHGRHNFAILTADYRLANIVERATSMNKAAQQKLGLVDKAKSLGLECGPEMYPQVFNLASCSDSALKEFFGQWPLPQRPVRPTKSQKLRRKDAELLVRLRKNSGIPRDQLPYTRAFEDICEEAERRTGRPIDRHEAWLAILRIEKQGPKRN